MFIRCHRSWNEAYALKREREGITSKAGFGGYWAREINYALGSIVQSIGSTYCPNPSDKAGYLGCESEVNRMSVW